MSARARAARLRYTLALMLAMAAAGLVAVHERHRWRERLSPLWVRTVHDVPYGPRPENRLDVLRRRWGGGPKTVAAVVVFHGGGWNAGSREDMLVRVCHRYLEHGFVVANVEYRKGAVAPAVEDAVLALRCFVRHAPEYGGDRKRIVVTGESAGAHLALMAAFTAGEPVAAVVNFYGVSDLAGMLRYPAIQRVLPEDRAEAAAKSLSPLTYIRPGLPPVLSIHGTADPQVLPTHSAALTRALRAADGDADEFDVKGGKHGFTAAPLRATTRLAPAKVRRTPLETSRRAM